MAGGLVAATAVLTPAIAVAGTSSASAATPVAKVVQQAKTKSWAERQKLAQKALRAAASKKGKPYRWGASGPNAFDCSGLVQWSYKKAGVALPRVTGSQYSAVKNKISWKNLAPGDLVFFNGKRHVGLVYKKTGNTLHMIHSPHSGSSVKVVKLDGYRKRTFAGAVRPY
ncbi:C40 family peptidase [Actinomadura kijaniata]|uniref:Cell wall-associated NlpC family hydrolase n=1 Tax=Actinomadura namibiensis TaxID=182080 RepID=A0A7W3QQP4_ACTNM|nr:C40 family peptidase [Actinomadura namibiensis]MBA8955856.1 cell wall-associated NlpC family hydrolase [Actinomadura namibiensis]